MKLKIGFPTYLLITFAVWVSECHAVPPSRALSPTGRPLVSIPIPQASAANDNGKPESGTTIGPLAGNEMVSMGALAVAQRSKRDTKDQLDSKAHFGMFSPGDARNADDALQKLFLLLSMTKPRTPVGVDEYDDEYDNPPIDLVLGKEPGSIRSSRRMGSQKKDSPTLNGEEPTGVPIVLYQHRLNKKSVPTLTHVIPEIFLRDAATSSRTQPEPKIMRKLLERIGFTRQLRSLNDDGRFYFMGQLAEPSSINEGNQVVRRLVL